MRCRFRKVTEVSWIDEGPAAGSNEDNILKVHGLSPEAYRGHVTLYKAAMHHDSPLSRAQREMIAVVVSAANRCDY